MSEEMNGRESALSDAELENVSGAGLEEDHEISARAQSICNQCKLNMGTHCSGTYRSSLAAYLKEHGIKSVLGYRDCPYYYIP